MSDLKRPRRIDWPAVALFLAKRFPLSRLHPAALAWARAAERGRRAREPWAVAFSGGADSLALVLLLWAHWPERRGQLGLLHFDHRLRGAASTRDARFCQRVARALGLTCAVARWRRPPSAGSKTVSEQAARQARFAFFSEQLSAVGGRCLWLGHQQDDIAETLLMRVARGSGTAGLAAPRPVHAMADGTVHVRPLLTLKKAELAAALTEAGATWCDDATNAGQDYLRSRVRGAVVEPWSVATGVGRDALAGAALTRELLEEDAVALDQWLARVAPLDRWGRLDLGKLAGLPRAIQRRALHAWLVRHRDVGDLSRQGFERLLDAIGKAAATRFSLGRHFGVIRAGRLYFERTSSRPSSLRSDAG